MRSSRQIQHTIVLVVLLLVELNLQAQVKISATVVSKRDSVTLAFAQVKVVETNSYYTTDEQGRFEFQASTGNKIFHFEIAAIGCHATVTASIESNKELTVYVDQFASTLNNVEIEGVTAVTAVRRAILAIPENYTDSSYADYSFYRQYQRINDHYKNLLEAQLVVMFNLIKENKQTTAKESFAVEELRRSSFQYPVPDFYADELPALFNQNPIYHLQESTLNLKALRYGYFSFDSIQTAKTYVIDYYFNSNTSDSHGFDNFSTLNFNGESYEYGTLWIDKDSYAIRRITRYAKRNNYYHYPKYNNFLVPSRAYTVEFSDGYLEAEYQQFQGKWYLNTLVRDYSNAFYKTQTYEKEYVITDHFEWYSGEITRLIPNDLIRQFYFNPEISQLKYNYHPKSWQKRLPEFQLAPQNQVYEELSKTIPLEQQFEKEGKK